VEIRSARSTLGRPADLFYLPSATIIKAASFDYENLVADLIWVKTIIYFSDQFTSRNDFEHLEILLNIVTDLDPRFEKAYIWGGTSFIYNGKFITADSINKSNKLLLKGWDFYNQSLVKWRISDDFWRIPFSIGFNYWAELKDKVTGAQYIKEAAKFPGIPDYMRTLSSTLLRKSGKLEEALDVLQEQLEIEKLQYNLNLTENSQMRDNLIGQIKNLYTQAASKNLKLEDFFTRQSLLQHIYEDYRQDFNYLSFNFYQLIYSPEQKNLHPPLFEWLNNPA
jgi:hypothetical protein